MVQAGAAWNAAAVQIQINVFSDTHTHCTGNSAGCGENWQCVLSLLTLSRSLTLRRLPCWPEPATILELLFPQTPANLIYMWSAKSAAANGLCWLPQ